MPYYFLSLRHYITAIFRHWLILLSRIALFSFSLKAPARCFQRFLRFHVRLFSLFLFRIFSFLRLIEICLGHAFEAIFSSHFWPAAYFSGISLAVFHFNIVSDAFSHVTPQTGAANSRHFLRMITSYHS